MHSCCLFVVIICILLHSISCYNLVQPFNISSLYPDSTSGHIFGLANSSPVAQQIRKNPQAKKALKDIVAIFQKFSDVAEQRRKVHAQNACSPPSDDYIGASLYSVHIRQIGQFTDDCDTIIAASTATKSRELDIVRDVNPISVIQRNANMELFKAARQIPQIPSQQDQSMNWTRGTYRIGDWDLHRNDQKCTLERTIAYTINGKWYVRVAITNAHVDLTLGEYQRQHISEYVHEDLGKSYTTIHPRYNLNEQQNQSTQPLMESTTLFERWAGRVGLSATGNFDFDTNLALKEAFKQNAIAVNLASDAITPSNIAILVLPMLMSLLPIAFIADLNSWATIWYIIFTDVFSVLPMFIKGIELLKSTTDREGIVVLKLGDEKMGQMELFSAHCSGKDSFLKWGVIFMVLSFVGIVVGVGLEIYAEKYMKWHREKQGDDYVGPFGEAGIEITRKSLLGRGLLDEQNECDDKSDDSSDDSSYTQAGNTNELYRIVSD